MTGHRAEAFDDYSSQYTKQMLGVMFDELRPKKIIQGMAHGVDLWSAEIAFNKRIPYIAVRPYLGHSVPDIYRVDYSKALQHAEEVIVVNNDENYLVQYMHDRNRWMVDHADAVCAVWNGASRGGTSATVKYASKVGKPIYRYNPETGERGWM